MAFRVSTFSKACFVPLSLTTYTGIDIPNITHLTPYPGTRIYEQLKQGKRLFNEQFWLKDPFPIFTFQPENMGLDELKEITVELIDSFIGFAPSVKRFLRTAVDTHSVRAAFYSLAESLNACRNLKKNVLHHG